MATSTGLADAVAAALGEDPVRVRLQLRTIRAAGENISFTGFGRGAAAMTPADAAHLIIAVAGSIAAKHAADTLDKFKDLKATGNKYVGRALAEFLAERIAVLATGERHADREWSYDSPRYNLAAEEGLRLIWCAAPADDTVPRVGIVRWFRPDGGSDAVTFASEPMPYPMVNEARLAKLYPNAGLLRSGCVTARALFDIASAL